MAYPFAAAPTLGELKSRLKKEFDCEFKSETKVKSGESGEQFIITFFERSINGETLQCVIDLSDFENDDAIVNLPIVKSICRRLRIDAKNFGYTLN